MKKRIIHDISASTLQVFINQLAGLLIFYITSQYLSKQVFGEISWSLAVLMVGFAVLGCGIDQIVVRKTAAGEDAAALLIIYLFHVLLTGTGFLIVLLIVRFFSSGVIPRLDLLLYLGLGQLFIFISLPFKQVTNGKERFRRLFLMSTGANALRAAILLIMALVKGISLSSFIIIYIAGSALELIVCICLGRNYLRGKLLGKAGTGWWRPAGWARFYSKLIRESLPQSGVILFNAGIARFDWILLGMISTAPVLAEYSFAYKAFELSGLPLLILAPLLLPRITKWCGRSFAEGLEKRKGDLLLLARMEMIIACFISLVLNLTWAPVIDWLTNNRYGAVNSTTIFILTCALPFLYINNILWSIHFARGHLSFIFSVFGVTFLITCTGDLVLIPFLQGKGAAIAYLSAMVIQYFHLSRRIPIEGLSRLGHYTLLCGSCALASGFLTRMLPGGAGLQVIMASCLYGLFLFACRQIRPGDWIICKKIIYA